jgi:hypothetical protein
MGQFSPISIRLERGRRLSSSSPLRLLIGIAPAANFLWSANSVCLSEHRCLQEARLDRCFIAPERFAAPDSGGPTFRYSKNMKFGERVSGQLRWETFNTFNHTNPICCASTSFTSSLFNQVTATRDPRIMQLGMKVNF